MAVAAVIALAVGGVLVWRFARHDPQVAAATVGTPKNMLVSFPLTQEPVPGWRTTTADIGLPAHVHIGSVFSSNGDRVYLSTKDCGGDCQQEVTGHEGPSTGFVYGLNLRTGKPLYRPVRLADFGGSTCHGNGPSVAVCLGFDDALKPKDYVVDLDRGAVIYSGTNELTNPQEVGEPYGVTRLVDVVGHGYEVEPGSGVYGVGSHAEHTWYVPGTGSAHAPGSSEVNDMASLTLEVQSEGAGQPDRVFSVIDGRDMTPTTDKGTLDTAEVFQGGFAYQYSKDESGGGILMYDDAGQLSASIGTGRLYLQNSAALPILLDKAKSKWFVMTFQGSLLMQLPATDLVANFKTIGTTLFVQKPADLHNIDQQNPWQQWDLWTGKSAGPDCKFDFSAGSYVGSDGRIIITAGEQIGQTIAVDRATCTTIWQFPNRTSVWKVGTGLLRSEYPLDAITSLRAPD